MNKMVFVSMVLAAALGSSLPSGSRAAESPLLLAGSAFAAPIGAAPAPARRLPRSHVVTKIRLQDIDLSYVQRRKISAAIRKVKRHTSRVFRELHVRRIRHAFWSATPGTQQFNTAEKQYTEVEAKWRRTVAQSYVQVRQAIHEVLTPEQRKKVSSYLSRKYG